MQITLQPVLFEPDKDILSLLEKALLKEFNASFSSSVVTAPAIKQTTEQQLLLLFDNQRNQWKSTDILEWLSDKYKKLYYSKKQEEQQQQKYLLFVILMHIPIS